MRFPPATELQSQLYIALDQNYIDQQQFSRIYRQAVETKRLIGGFIRYLKKSQVQSPGSKVTGRLT
jgi:hypothetical protein